ncbi:Pectate lyase superfamily protein [Lacunisphaera limnophila]|uniref:Pectate lyase superfamily protein n=1 Tax=Lacunisphaera limnophila TaxID=1838286 RepID=A0A1D8AVC8_9BACT|nr:glycosyl hydrolase family 28-related protein [Lacunisphaera limnophila]AOS44850.1 Pectate lyase superfamily protein [Lacunisphaera limnophila]
MKPIPYVGACLQAMVECAAPSALGATRSTASLILLLLCAVGLTATVTASPIGADLPWTTVEAEAMSGTGTLVGPVYAPHRVETEASGQQAVQVARAGGHVEFAAPLAANALVLRYHLPDAPAGGGTDTALRLLVNGRFIRELALTSRNMWLYGNYPFSNDPAQGKPRNFYDELRVKNLEIGRGDVVRLEKAADDGIACVLDLVDLELVPAPLARPAGSQSLLDFGARGDGVADDTAALLQGVAAVAKDGGTLWVPPGDYKITGDIIVPSAVTIQGAGMWHTTFAGDEALYAQAGRRVRFKLTGTGMRLADFAIFGHLNYRNDQEPNDGIVGAGCTDAVVSRIWIEHTKAGVWVYNGVNLLIEGCRFRNLLADGVNFCVGTSRAVVDNCTARGTGDDCFAVWPAPSDQGFDERAGKPGHNVIRRSTGQLTFLANGASLYGGADNRIEDCLFTDIATGCGILVSTTFPTADEAGKVDNNFSGTTVVRNNRLVRCGGYDHSWAWRGSLQICMDRRSIAGLQVSGLEIRDSISDGITVVGPGRAKGQGTLSAAVLEDVKVSGSGLGAPGRPDLFIREDAGGSLSLIRAQVPSVRNESKDFEIKMTD